MRTCNYCGSIENFDYEEETGREYCLECNHYTGLVDESQNRYGGIYDLCGDY